MQRCLMNMRSVLPDITGQSVMDCKMQKLIFCCLSQLFFG
nr:MAG TPA: hypothetical protein [Caudoviricetes sp.]